MRRFINICLALVFFGGALGLGVSTLYRGTVQGTAPVSKQAMREAPSVSSRSIERRERRQARREARRNARRDWAPQIGPLERVAFFFNDTLGLSRMSISVVDIISLMFGFLGTVFTYRSYRIQKRQAEAFNLARNS